MPQIAGFRGALWNPAKVELAKVAAAPIDKAKELLADGSLVRDPTRAVYLYNQVFPFEGRTITRSTPSTSRAICACTVIPPCPTSHAAV